MASLPTLYGASPLNAQDGTVHAFTSDTDADVFSDSFDSTPADFASMDTLSWTVTYFETSEVDDTLGLSIRIVNGTTILAAADSSGTYQSVNANITNTSTTTTGPTAFSYVNTSANKATWDGASIDLEQSYSRLHGGDNCYVSADYVALTGTYTQGAADYPVSGSAAISLSAAGNLETGVGKSEGPVLGATPSTSATLEDSETAGAIVGGSSNPELVLPSSSSAGSIVGGSSTGSTSTSETNSEGTILGASSKLNVQQDAAEGSIVGGSPSYQAPNSVSVSEGILLGRILDPTFTVSETASTTFGASESTLADYPVSETAGLTQGEDLETKTTYDLPAEGVKVGATEGHDQQESETGAVSLTASESTKVGTGEVAGATLGASPETASGTGKTEALSLTGTGSPGGTNTVSETAAATLGASEKTASGEPVSAAISVGASEASTTGEHVVGGAVLGSHGTYPQPANQVDGLKLSFQLDTAVVQDGAPEQVTLGATGTYTSGGITEVAGAVFGATESVAWVVPETAAATFGATVSTKGVADETAAVTVGASTSTGGAAPVTEVAGAILGASPSSAAPVSVVGAASLGATVEEALGTNQAEGLVTGASVGASKNTTSHLTGSTALGTELSYPGSAAVTSSGRVRVGATPSTRSDSPETLQGPVSLGANGQAAQNQANPAQAGVDLTGAASNSAEHNTPETEVLSLGANASYAGMIKQGVGPLTVGDALEISLALGVFDGVQFGGLLNLLIEVDPDEAGALGMGARIHGCHVTPHPPHGDFPYIPPVIDYLKTASRFRDYSTRPRVLYYPFDEDSTDVIDPMTKEVVNQVPKFLDPVSLPAKLEIRTPGGTFVTPEGPFHKENKITLTVGQATLGYLCLRPKPRDEFEVSGVRYRIVAFDRSKFMQNNQASLDYVYTVEFVERGQDDLPFSPTVVTTD